ncbi:MAG: FAD-binding oxidoreductase [Betaproteobacteria bacterium]|jgi:sarcosine oxidase subunit beta|nr:FAD-binding oxidoreductase [Betaproteobacteria bacterium]MDH5285461.1 FAD-binding oxidoreductase [Betaproteobacteria bacterium]
MSPPAACDVLVLGAGVIGCSTAWHAARLGARRVVVIDRRGVAEGTSAQSSGILRTHYSVAENVELARRSLTAFRDFGSYLGDPEADCGLALPGYLIVGDEGARSQAIRAALAQQRAMGIDAVEIDARQAREILPLLRTHDLAVFGFEKDAGYADPYLTATAFARAARRLGVEFRLGETVAGLTADGGRVTGARTDRASYAAGVTVCALNVWSNGVLEQLTGVGLPLVAERHEVMALEAPQPYLPRYPVLKDMTSPSMIYARCYGTRQLLVSAGLEGQPTSPDEDQADVPLDVVAQVGSEAAHRLPAFETAGVASTWTGLYDVTPDWNPVLGPLPGWDGLVVAFGFSGHGFKLSPAVGELLAQAALGLPTAVALAPYRCTRFAEGALLAGAYGKGAVS